MLILVSACVRILVLTRYLGVHTAASPAVPLCVVWPPLFHLAPAPLWLLIRLGLYTPPYKRLQLILQEVRVIQVHPKPLLRIDGIMLALLSKDIITRPEIKKL